MSDGYLLHKLMWNITSIYSEPEKNPSFESGVIHRHSKVSEQPHLEFCWIQRWNAVCSAV